MYFSRQAALQKGLSSNGVEGNEENTPVNPFKPISVCNKGVKSGWDYLLYVDRRMKVYCTWQLHVSHCLIRQGWELAATLVRQLVCGVCLVAVRCVASQECPLTTRFAHNSTQHCVSQLQLALPRSRHSYKYSRRLLRISWFSRKHIWFPWRESRLLSVDAG